VLPGLLAVWAARHDIRQYGKLDFDQFTRGYFPMAVKAYCVGLLLADGAVMLFETGQPALLYIVPCLLGSILYRSFYNDSLAVLWSELPEMKLVALPIHSDEQDSLLNSNVVVAEAIWNKTREHESYITVLDNTYVAPIRADSALAQYQNSIVAEGNGDLPSKFVRKNSTNKKKSKRHSERSTAILDNNTSHSVDDEEDALRSFIPSVGWTKPRGSDDEPI